MKKKIDSKKILLIFFMIVFIGGIIYSGVSIFKRSYYLKQNKKIQDSINTNIKIEEDSNTKEIVYKIDFDELKKINKDTVGYIDYSTFNINYVVVQTNNNEYYLNHNYEKKYNDAGWIFIDSKNKLDGTDKNIILYGHSMKNGSMFGNLHNLLKNNNYENPNNQTIKYVTENGTYEYKIFSAYIIDNEDYYLKNDFSTNDDFKSFIKNIKNRSKYNFNIDENSIESIITLSTCYGYTSDKRMVVHAAIVKENIYE